MDGFSGLSLGIVGTPRFPSPNGEYVQYCELPRIWNIDLYGSELCTKSFFQKAAKRQGDIF